MSKFMASYAAFWVNYVNFSGRTRRSDYWYAMLGQFIVGFIVGVIVGITGLDILTTILSIASFLPGLAIVVRRLHDVGRSGLWWLLSLTGIGAIVILVWMCMDSQPGSNKYGPNPKGM